MKVITIFTFFILSIQTNTFSLEIDKKLLFSIINFSKSKRTLLINKGIENGLKKVGFSEAETNGILGNNWYNFYKSI